MQVTIKAKSGKQIVIDAILEDIETGRPLAECPPGRYSAKIVVVTHHELDRNDKKLKALRSYQRQAIDELRNHLKSKETKPAKGPRNRWGGVK